MLLSPAPDFTLPTDNNTQLSLSSLRGQHVVLYFYPKDDTPGCTTEAKDFASFLPEFTALNSVILGVSRDSTESHRKFKEKHCLPFPLLSDAEGTVCEAYGVWVEKHMYGKQYMGIERSTFLIDKAGIIRKNWRKVSVTQHVQNILTAVKTL